MPPIIAPRSIPRALAACTMALAAAGCSDGTAPLRPLQPRTLLLRAASDTDRAGIAAADGYAPAVRVTDATGAPIARVRVSFSVVSGDGHLAAGQAVTNAAGVASAGRWSLGGALGVQQARAFIGDSIATRFRVTAVPATGPLNMDGRCPASDSVRPTGWVLPRLTARVAAREPLTIVAIGSSSTAGHGASTADSSYPSLLRRHLVRAFPASAITVRNQGIGGQSLPSLQARFANDVLAASPHLVVLQTGTIDAQGSVPLATFVAQLHAAIDQLLGAGTDVVLMDSQWYPGGEYQRYRDFQVAMATVASTRGIPIVRRYAWMAEVRASGTYTAAQLLASDGFHTSDLTYSCTARLLAEGIVGAVAGAARR